MALGTLRSTMTDAAPREAAVGDAATRSSWAHLRHRVGVWADALRYNLPYWWVMAWNLVLWVTAPGPPFLRRPHPPAIEALERSWTEVRAELDALLAEPQHLARFQDVDPGQRRLADDDRWHLFVLRFYGVDVPEARARCPRTCALVDEIEGVETTMFSIMAPGKVTPWHAGGVKGVLRYHLPLIVTDPDACGIELKPGGVHRWHEGEGVLFDDTYPHQAWNRSDSDRVVLWLDVVRPLRWAWLRRANRRVLDRLAASERIRGGARRAGQAAA